MSFVVVIPTYNEASSIGRLLGQILGLFSDVHIVVVDDRSPDGTGDIARGVAWQHPNVHVLTPRKRRGYGYALREGFRAGSKFPCIQWIISMDGDMSHDAREICRILELLKRCEVVVGSRYRTGSILIGRPFYRFVGSLFFRLYFNVLLQLRLSDPTSGFRGFALEVIEDLCQARIVADGYGFIVETNLLFRRHGRRICEVPISFKERQGGRSKLSMNIILESLLLPWRLRFRCH